MGPATITKIFYENELKLRRMTNIAMTRYSVYIGKGLIDVNYSLPGSLRITII